MSEPHKSFVEFVATIHLRCCAEGCREAVAIGCEDYSEGKAAAKSRGWKIRICGDLAWCPAHGTDYEDRALDVARHRDAGRCA